MERGVVTYDASFIPFRLSPILILLLTRNHLIYFIFNLPKL